MRFVLVSIAVVSLAAFAHAEPRPQPRKQATVMHYRTLEKMLRRFSTLAGEARAADARTRG
jgi:hypothetical protein